MFEEQRPLPWSGRRYFISNIGEVITRDGEILETSQKNGEVHVRLDWVCGRRDYPVAVLVLVSYGLVRLPDHLLEEIVPLYKDGSSTNLAPTNLLYKFKSKQVEVEEFPGFYYIPFYVDYAISKSGELINISTGKHKSWSVTKPNLEKKQRGGYRYSRVINDLGFSKTLFQHRALCYVFKDYGADVDELVVNHIDGNPENNSLCNLEWVTYQRNNIHAIEIGLRGDNKPVLSRNIATGEILRFESIAACGRHYGQPRAGFVIHRLFHGLDKVYPDMLQFKFDDGFPWPEVDKERVTFWRAGKATDIRARNVFTGEIVVFSGTYQGESLLGVKAATILSHLKDNKVIPVNGWNFRWGSDSIIWPQHSERHLRIYSKFPIYPPDGAIVHNIETDEEEFFESVALMCQKFKIAKHVFYNHVASGRIFDNKYRLRIFKIREHLSPPTE